MTYKILLLTSIITAHENLGDTQENYSFLAPKKQSVPTENEIETHCTYRMNKTTDSVKKLNSKKKKDYFFCLLIFNF